MRYSLLLIIALAACGPKTVPDLEASGVGIGPFYSEKTPMQFAGCAIPAYDRALPGIYQAQMRPTPTGLEVIKTAGVGMGAIAMVGVIRIDEAVGGSSVVGTASRNFGSSSARSREIEAAIHECL